MLFTSVEIDAMDVATPLSYYLGMLHNLYFLMLRETAHFLKFFGLRDYYKRPLL